MSTRYEPLTVQVPDDWTPQQALAVYDLLHELAETIWDRYEIPLIGLLAPPCNDKDPAQPELFDFDDPLSF
jgi:hypothetical protein